MLELVDTFNKLIKYPKAKRNQSFEKKVKDFFRNSETLFDIFCYDDKKQSEIVTESEFKFFEDQKGLRLAKCIKEQEKLSACELRFQQRCSYEAQFHQPSTSSTYTETMSLSSGSDSEVLISETSSHEFYEPSAKKQKSDFVQNHEHYFYLAQCCDRYNISDRDGAALATSVLIDHGIIEPSDTKLVIDQSKLQRERMRHTKKVTKEQKLFGQVDALYVDGKRDAILLLKEVDGKYSRKVEIEEHIVMVGQPGEFYLSHMSPDSETGLSITTSLFNEI